MNEKYLVEEFVKANAKEHMQIKGYDIYMIDILPTRQDLKLGCIAFKNGHMIDHLVSCNYSLCETENDLRNRYIEVMNHKLYTEDELKTISSYDDYTQKSYFIHNYYGNERDHLSWFGIEHRAGYENMDADVEERKKVYTVNNNVAFCYNLPEDAEFVNHMNDLLKDLYKAKEEAENSKEYMVSAIYYEMCNHEYGINWQADWDVCGCFGKCKYGENKTYRDYLTEMGKPEWIPYYKEAKQKYHKAAMENDWF